MDKGQFFLKLQGTDVTFPMLCRLHKRTRLTVRFLTLVNVIQ